MDKQTEMSLRRASIFELRNIARDVGVVSPTTYKKEDLIAKVCNILSGAESPEIPKSRQGRPPKVKSNQFVDKSRRVLFKGLDEEKGNNGSYDFSSIGEENDFDMLADSGFDFFSEADVEEGEFAGYLMEIGKDRSFLFPGGHSSSAKGVVYVPAEVMSVHNMRLGDYVKCSYRQLAKNAKYIDEVKSKEQPERLVYEQIAHKRLSQCENKPFKIKFGKTEILEGSKNIILTPSRANEYEVYSLFETIKDVKKLTLRLDLIPEDEHDDSFENFWTYIGDSERRNMFSIKLAYERLKRLIEKGEKVVVYFCELLKLVRYFNLTHGYSALDIKEGSFSLCMLLMRMAGFYENGASVTIVSIMKHDGSKMNNLLEEDLRDVACNFVDVKDIIN